MSAKFTKSSATYDQLPKAGPPEYAFIGRSNVGKSSLINMLMQQKGLAKTSAKPGKTKLINHFWVDEGWYIVDLPGYGYAQVSKVERKKFEKMITDYLVKRQTLVICFVLIDSRHPPMENDLEFLRMLGERQVPFAIVFTKADKKGDTQKKVLAYQKELAKEWEAMPGIFVSSAVTGEGREEILSYIESLNDQITDS